MPRYLFGYLNRAVIRQEAEKVMAGKSGHRRVPVRFYQQLQIPLPSLDGQKKIIRIVERHESEIGRFKDRLRELEKKEGRPIERIFVRQFYWCDGFRELRFIG